MTYLSEVLADTPHLVWLCNVGLADSSGNGNTATNNGAVAFGTAGSGVLAEYPTAATFPGGGVTSQLVRNVTTLAADTPYSVEAWFKTTTINGYLLNNITNLASSYVFRLGIPSGLAGFRVYNTSSTAFDANGSTNLADGVPHHMVGTYDGTTARLYIDGAFINSVVPTGTARYPVTMRMGGDSTGANSYIGAAGGLAFYPTTALSAARITAHYSAGIAVATRYIRTIGSTASVQMKQPNGTWSPMASLT